MNETWSSYGINWMWYLEVERIDEDTVRFVREYRLHKFDCSTHPETKGEYLAGRKPDEVYLGGRFTLVLDGDRE